MGDGGIGEDDLADAGVEPSIGIKEGAIPTDGADHEEPDDHDQEKDVGQRGGEDFRPTCGPH